MIEIAHDPRVSPFWSTAIRAPSVAVAATSKLRPSIGSNGAVWSPIDRTGAVSPPVTRASTVLFTGISIGRGASATPSASGTGGGSGRR